MSRAFYNIMKAYDLNQESLIRAYNGDPFGVVDRWARHFAGDAGLSYEQVYDPVRKFLHGWHEAFYNTSTSRPYADSGGANMLHPFYLQFAAPFDSLAKQYDWYELTDLEQAGDFVADHAGEILAVAASVVPFGSTITKGLKKIFGDKLGSSLGNGISSILGGKAPTIVPPNGGKGFLGVVGKILSNVDLSGAAAGILGQNGVRVANPNAGASRPWTVPAIKPVYVIVAALAVGCGFVVSIILRKRQ